MIELFQKGGIMMYPLAICSILAVAIVLERLWTVRRKRILIPEIVGVLDQIHKDEDFPLVESVCRKFEGPFARIVLACIQNRDLPSDELRTLIEDQGRQEVRTLNRGLVLLETVAAVAPLMGLLGTVLGMIKVFEVIQTLGVGQAKALSGGISEALITTATGLFIGIPVLILYNYLASRSENLILDIEKYTVDLLNRIIRMKRETSEEVQINFRSS
ncbi:MAG: MotA/TolQ/ExbB proton channel family protein [Calditrichaeota bacterium]|nr:MAG: MotA/TolQ/ExbB proton channel family protein [Calditrichota bacterium]